MVKRLRRLAVPLACLALLALTTQARAAFSVTLTQVGGNQNGTTLTLTDGGVQDLSGPGDGIIAFAGTFGDFLFDFVSVREASNASQALLQTTEFAVRNGVNGAVTLRVQTSSVPFVQPGGSGDTLDVASSLASSFISSGGSSTYGSMIDSTALAGLTITEATAPAGVSTSLQYQRGSSFTLSSTLNLTLGAWGTAQVTGTTVATLAATTMPEPSSAMLLLTGLPMVGLGMHWFRRRRLPVTLAV